MDEPKRRRSALRLGNPLRTLLFALVGLASSAYASDPVSYEEISVSLKVKEPSAVILSEVKRRQLLRPLTQPQLATLKTLGASAALLAQVQRAETIAPAAVAEAVEKRIAQEKAQNSPAPAPGASPPPTGSASSEELRLANATRLVVEKIVILKEPLHSPFYAHVAVSANNGQTKESFHAPGTTYSLGGLDQSVTIPMNVALKDVREGEWATVTLSLDVVEANAGTAGARVKHTTRIPISEKGIYGAMYNTDPPSVEVIASSNPNNEFVFQIFWHLR